MRWEDYARGMPVVDKPLGELQSYLGINPRPHDFDAYWGRALAELDAVDPAPELEPNHTIRPQGVECFDLTFSSVKGARIYAKYFRPKDVSRKCPAGLEFHGYAGNSGSWSSKLPLVSQGFCFASMECRGQGGRSEDAGGVKGTTLRGHIIRGLDDHPDSLLFRQIFLDTAQLARVVASFEEVDADRMATMGGSQGGALALACAALYPAIKRAVPTFPFLCDYKRVWEMDLCKNAYEELYYYFRSFDPRHLREEEVWTTLGYIDIQHLAPRIEAEVYWGIGLMDTICPPSTQFAAYNKIGSPKRMEIYPDFGHENLPRWDDLVFNFLTGIRD